MAQIKIIKENGKTIYPATIGEAVVINKDAKRLSAVVEELKTADTTNATAITTEVSRAKAAEGTLTDLSTTEKGSLVGAVNEVKASADAIQQTLNAGGSYPFYAAGRVKGSASPKFTKFYGSQSGLEAVLKHLRIGTIKDGKISHLGAAGRLTLADNGEDIAIDGTDGDVCVIADTTIYMLRGTAEIDGEKYNMIGLGLSPFVVGGVQAKEIQPFFFSADYTVNAKIGDDTVTKAYCIYNEAVAGSYQAKTTANTLFEEDMKPNGNGYPSQQVDAGQNGEYARNKNTDVESNSPYMGLWVDWYELWMIAMYLELGTLDFCADNLFGYGCTSYYFSGSNSTTPNTRTTFPDKIGSVRIATKDGSSVFWGNLMSQLFRIGAEGSVIYNVDGFAGSGHYGFLQCLEHDRWMDNIVKVGLTEYVDNEDAIFTDKGSTVFTDGSINLNTGEGMNTGQYYGTVRSVDGCKGLADGVMTAVVELYVKLTIKDGIYYLDGTTDLSGGTAIFKFSLPVYRGVCWFKGMFTQLEGFYYRQVNTDGTAKMEYWSADDIRNAPVIRTDTGYYDGEELTGVLKGMTKKFETEINTGWYKDMDYDINLHSYGVDDSKDRGANTHTYECGYVYKYASWGAGNIDSTGKMNEGHSVVNASVGGCNANAGDPGRSLGANNAFRSGNGYFAGALAGLVQQ